MQTHLYSHGSGAVGRLTPWLLRFIPPHSPTAAMSASGAAGSAAGLAITAGGGGGAHLGPGLAPGMGEAEAFERLNAWGVARDGELVDLRSSIANTQTVVGTMFAEARGTLMTIVHDFRLEAETTRNHSAYEATQTLARLEQVVSEARARFDAQDARVSQDLGELAQRVAAGPPQAAVFQAAPAPAFFTSPFVTVRFFPFFPFSGFFLHPSPMAFFSPPQLPPLPPLPPPPLFPPPALGSVLLTGRSKETRSLLLLKRRCESRAYDSSISRNRNAAPMKIVPMGLTGPPATIAHEPMHSDTTSSTTSGADLTPCLASSSCWCVQG